MSTPRTPRTPLAWTALIANGGMWGGLSLMFLGIAGEQTYAAFSGQWFNVLGWVLIVTVAVGLAVVGVIENRNIRAGKTYKPRPRR